MARHARLAHGMNSIRDIDVLIGRPVLSIETANKLGQVDDLIVDPVTGRLAGLSISTLDGTGVLVDLKDIGHIGPDAVMVAGESSLLPPASSSVSHLPLAKNQLLGAKVITEGGELLGEIRNVFLDEKELSLLVYEVYSSIFDKLLGNNVYFPASAGCAFSADGTRLVISNSHPAARKLSDVAIQVFGPPKCGGPEVTVRSHG